MEHLEIFFTFFRNPFQIFGLSLRPFPQAMRPFPQAMMPLAPMKRPVQMTLRHSVQNKYQYVRVYNLDSSPNGSAESGQELLNPDHRLTNVETIRSIVIDI